MVSNCSQGGAKMENQKTRKKKKRGGDITHLYLYISNYFHSVSLVSKNRVPEERNIETAKQSKSPGDCITTFLLLSKNPIRSSITMTCPSFVFSSFTVLTFIHLGRSCRNTIV